MNVVVAETAERTSIVDLLTAAGIARSAGEARRFIAQRAVAVNDAVIDDPNATFDGHGWVELRFARTGRALMYLVPPG